MPAIASPKSEAVSLPSTLASKSGGSPMRAWSAVELRLMIAELKAKLSSGLSEIQVAEEMSLDTQQYNALKREMYNADKLEMASKNSEEVFIDYRLRQEGCIHDLETMTKTFKETKQYNAMVGAIRAKSDIIDRIVQRGQEFGVLEKVPEKKQIVAGILVAGLSNDELRMKVARETIGMNELLKTYGDGDILSLPDPAAPKTITVTAEPTHGLPVPKFNAGMKPKTTTGGLTKAAGGKAAVAARKIVPPPFSLAD